MPGPGPLPLWATVPVTQQAWSSEESSVSPPPFAAEPGPQHLRLGSRQVLSPARQNDPKVQSPLCRGGPKGPVGQLETSAGSRLQDPPLKPQLGEGAVRSWSQAEGWVARSGGRERLGDGVRELLREAFSDHSNRPSRPPNLSGGAGCPLLTLLSLLGPPYCSLAPPTCLIGPGPGRPPAHWLNFLAQAFSAQN